MKCGGAQIGFRSVFALAWVTLESCRSGFTALLLGWEIFARRLTWREETTKYVFFIHLGPELLRAGGEGDFWFLHIFDGGTDPLEKMLRRQNAPR